MGSRWVSRAVRAVAIGVVLFLQVVGLGILLLGLMDRSDRCIDTGSCGEGSVVALVVSVAVAVAVLLGAFVMGALVAGISRPVPTGLAVGVVAWSGGILLAAVAGSRPLVGIVFGAGMAMVLVAPNRPPAFGAVAGAAGVVGLLEVVARNDRNGLVGLVLLSVVAMTVLAPAD